MNEKKTTLRVVNSLYYFLVRTHLQQEVSLASVALHLMYETEYRHHLANTTRIMRKELKAPLANENREMEGLAFHLPLIPFGQKLSEWTCSGAKLEKAKENPPR